VIGIIISALVNNYADLVQHITHTTSRDAAVQYTICGLVFLPAGDAGTGVRYRRKKIFQQCSVAFTPDGRYSLTFTTVISNIILFLISHIIWHSGIISSGLLFFVKVLLRLPESMGRCADGGDGTVFPYVLSPSITCRKRIGKKTVGAFFIWLIEPHFL